ncbi:hypothetical protein EW146_g8157 [Bondarzewia mesenterica]|uniref:Uncharacterized protein n=1 Tax=Bondarzewia mesenterica TaxID=1095465 RepID=A0A4S4LGQ8_9AGAM|nr:hypothetical protein EW146_g8157 [Bondarzewia mesenterica]
MIGRFAYKTKFNKWQKYIRYEVSYRNNSPNADNTTKKLPPSDQATIEVRDVSLTALFVPATLGLELGEILVLSAFEELREADTLLIAEDTDGEADEIEEAEETRDIEDGVREGDNALLLALAAVDDAEAVDAAEEPMADIIR